MNKNVFRFCSLCTPGYTVLGRLIVLKLLYKLASHGAVLNSRVKVELARQNIL